MSQGFGSEAPRRHQQTSHRTPTRFLVLIDAGGSTIARLVLSSGEQGAEFDASTEETALMTQGLVPTIGAEGSEWDRALQGHSPAERAAAAIYTLEL